MFYYASYTNYDTRDHDVSGHIEYIQYIISNRSLPNSDTCWQCYHPPLYHLLVSPIYYLASQVYDQPEQILQFFSIFLTAVFLYFAYKSYKLVLKDQSASLLALTLTAFWPSLIIHGIRLSNDALLYTLFSIAIYALIAWWDKGRHRHFLLAVIAASLAALTKSNGLTLWLIITFVYLVKLVKNWKHKKKILWQALILLLFAFTALLLYIKKANDPSMNTWPVANLWGMPVALTVGRGWENFTYFSPTTYFQYPYISPWLDETGRQFFWNYLLKTALFGEFNFTPTPLQIIYIIQILFFFLILIFLIRSWKIFLSLQSKYLIPLFVFSILIISLIFLRVGFPYSPSNDFRYILPILIPFNLIIGSDLITKNKNWKIILLLISFLFCLFSTLLFIAFGASGGFEVR
jgi:4-amino-4-deoxy-L-arabinose transferase-like glycosyltransferase